MLTAEERLKRWREHEHSSGWLGDAARIIIPKLEREISAQVGRNPKGEDTAEWLRRNDEHAVAKPCAQPPAELI